MAGIYTIVVIDYSEHNMGTQREISIPNAYKDKEVAKVKFRELLEQKLEELEYDVSEIDFGNGYEDITYFNLRKCGIDVEDDWFEMKLVYTEYYE